MRISDWSSDVCSSDLGRIGRGSGTWTPGCTASSSAPPTRRLYTRVARTPWEIPSQLGRAPRDRGRAAFRRRSMSKDLFGYTIPSLLRSEEHTSELQSLMRISYAVFCLKKKKH